MHHTEIFKVLSVETRVKIVNLLKSHGSMGAKEISEVIGISTAAVSQHLKVLKQAGLVTSQRQGYWIPYTLNEEALESCKEIVAEVCTCPCKSTGKILDYVPHRTELMRLKEKERKLVVELDAVKKEIQTLEMEEASKK